MLTLLKDKFKVIAQINALSNWYDFASGRFQALAIEWYCKPYKNHMLEVIIGIYSVLSSYARYS